MRHLRQSQDLPDVIFLDLNMPRKNGFECLKEIRSNPTFKNIAIIVFSTSMQSDVTDMLYLNGAQYYIRKPANYEELKTILGLTFSMLAENKFPVKKSDFVLKLPLP